MEGLPAFEVSHCQRFVEEVMSKSIAWDRDATYIASHPEEFTPTQRYLAWCYLYQKKTGKSIRQINLPDCSETIPDK